ncbi:MAG TPA: proprotein convertase P-domain-containing protein [Polyangiaceae bacterium]
MVAAASCSLKEEDQDVPASGAGGLAGSSGSSASGGKAGSSGGKAGAAGSSAGSGAGGGSSGRAGSNGKAGEDGRAGSGDGGDENQAGSGSGGGSNPSGGSGGSEPRGGQAGAGDAGGEGGSAGAEDSCTSPSECDDDDACTTDGCDGVCSNEPVSRDDSNPCTTDICDRESGVAHVPTTGGACTRDGGGGKGVCSAGICVAPGCGNGVVESGEDCEDDDSDNFDGCNLVCQAEPSVGPDADIQVTDNAYNGTLASMSCADLLVTSKGDGLVDLVTVRVGMAHGWIGDLTIKLISPENTVVTLLSRPGMAETTDDGTGTGAGESSDLEPAWPIVFVDGGATSAESMGSGIGTADAACEFDGLCVYAPNAGAAAPGTLASFVGETAAGTWKLCAGDSNMGDAGGIDSVVLSIVQ